jgi:hypothetical protein
VLNDHQSLQHHKLRPVRPNNSPEQGMRLP